MRLPVVRIGKHTQLFPQRFAIQSSTFPKSSFNGGLPELGEIIVFQLQTQLKMVAGNGFVYKEAFRSKMCNFSRVDDGYVKNPGPVCFNIPRMIFRRRSRCPKSFGFPDLKSRFRENAKI